MEYIFDELIQYDLKKCVFEKSPNCFYYDFMEKNKNYIGYNKNNCIKYFNYKYPKLIDKYDLENFNYFELDQIHNFNSNNFYSIFYDFCLNYLKLKKSTDDLSKLKKYDYIYFEKISDEEYFIHFSKFKPFEKMNKILYELTLENINQYKNFIDDISHYILKPCYSIVIYLEI